jgi:hypothetical protein
MASYPRWAERTSGPEKVGTSPDVDEDGSEKTTGDLVGGESEGVDGGPGADTASQRVEKGSSQVDKLASRADKLGSCVDKLIFRAVREFLEAPIWRSADPRVSFACRSWRFSGS